MTPENRDVTIDIPINHSVSYLQLKIIHMNERYQGTQQPHARPIMIPKWGVTPPNSKAKPLNNMLTGSTYCPPNMRPTDPRGRQHTMASKIQIAKKLNLELVFGVGHMPNLLAKQRNISHPCSTNTKPTPLLWQRSLLPSHHVNTPFVPICPNEPPSRCIQHITNWLRQLENLHGMDRQGRKHKVHQG